MSTYISIRIILIEITFITETFIMVTIFNRLGMIYSQHPSTFMDISQQLIYDLLTLTTTIRMSI